MPAAYLSADATVAAHRAATVTPSDTTNFGEPTRAIYVGGAGNVAVSMVDGGGSVTFVGVNAGYLLPLQVVQVFATGTTATNIIALF